jgi:hypothetical protein
VLENAVEALRGSRNVVVLTDIYGRYRAGEDGQLKVVGDRLAKHGASMLVLCEEAFAGRVVELAEMIEDARADNVLLFTHHEDAIAISACIPRAGVRHFFMHHADHQPTLGASIGTYVHIDNWAYLHERCSSVLPSPSRYIPLSSGDRGPKKFGKFDPARISTVTSGAWAKFSRPSAVPYADLVGAILGYTAGEHYHIGPVPEEALAALSESLAQRGFDPRRFRHTPWVPSVWEKLKELDAHVYVTSVPLSGGLAAIEAMGAGYPILYGRPYDLPDLVGRDVYYPGVAKWTRLDELENALRIVVENHGDAARRSRQHYETQYNPKQFAARLRDLAAREPQAGWWQRMLRGTPPP